MTIAVDDRTLDRLTEETAELLQAMIRNECVNDGSIDSGHEDRSARLLRDELEGTGVDLQLFEPTPGRTSIVARYPGTDPDAPALCLMGHTDVVPVSPDGWTHDPFGGERIGDEIWGRGAVDMLNLTSSMAVAFRHIVATGQRLPGDLIYFGVADEEAGGVHGAKVLLDTEWDALRCDYVLTEFGGMSIDAPQGRTLLVTTAEKGIGWRRIKVEGRPAHGSAPLGADNALITAAEVVRRLAAYSPKARLDELWAQRILAMGFDEDLTARLLDPGSVEEAILEMGPARAMHHACCHTTFSPNQIEGGVKTNVIPDEVTIEVDIRTLPGETDADVDAHLRTALGDDLMAKIETEIIHSDPSSASPIGTPLWDSLGDAMRLAYPEANVIPSIVTGGTDSRFFREKGVVAYGAGLLSPELDTSEFFKRFHGHDERIDLTSLRMTTKLWLDVVDRLWI